MNQQISRIRVLNKPHVKIVLSFVTLLPNLFTGMKFEFVLKKLKTDFMENSQKSEFREGSLAKRIETETAKIPSDVFLWAAIGSMAVSMSLQIAGKKNKSLFFGQWAGTFLLLGVYNKLVKQLGHDQYSQY